MERTEQFGPLMITATLDMDPGDPSVGIRAGWSEETGVRITAGPLVTYIQWKDYDDLRTPHNLKDPADWIVEDVQTELYGITVADSDDFLRVPPHNLTKVWRERVLRLSALPEVLQVVQAVYDAWNARERVEAASEALSYWQEQDYLAHHSEHGESYDPPEVIARELPAAKDELTDAMEAWNAIRGTVTE